MVRISPKLLPKQDRRVPAPFTAGLVWSADAPTMPGWYWIQEAPNDEPRIVCVIMWDGTQLVESQCGLDVRKMRLHRWAGPIERPVA